MTRKFLMLPLFVQPPVSRASGSSLSAHGPCSKAIRGDKAVFIIDLGLRHLIFVGNGNTLTAPREYGFGCCLPLHPVSLPCLGLWTDISGLHERTHAKLSLPGESINVSHC